MSDDSEIEDLENEIEELKSKIRVNEENPREDELDEYLDDMGDVIVAGYRFSPSRVLKELDPMAYRQELLNNAGARNEDLRDELRDKEDMLARLKGKKQSFSSGGLVQRTGYAEVHRGELVIPASVVKKTVATSPHYVSNRGQGGYFRHSFEHRVNRLRGRKQFFRR